MTKVFGAFALFLIFCTGCMKPLTSRMDDTNAKMDNMLEKLGTSNHNMEEFAEKSGLADAIKIFQDKDAEEGARVRMLHHFFQNAPLVGAAFNYIGVTDPVYAWGELGSVHHFELETELGSRTFRNVTYVHPQMFEYMYHNQNSGDVELRIIQTVSEKFYHVLRRATSAALLRSKQDFSKTKDDDGKPLDAQGMEELKETARERAFRMVYIGTAVMGALKVSGVARDAQYVTARELLGFQDNFIVEDYLRRKFADDLKDLLETVGQSKYITDLRSLAQTRMDIDVDW